MTESLEDMIFDARCVRFGELVRAYDGPTKFAAEVELRLRNYPELTDELTSFMNVSYISNATAGRKRIGEAPALQLELLFAKERGWMSGDAFENFLTRARKRRKSG